MKNKNPKPIFISRFPSKIYSNKEFLKILDDINENPFFKELKKDYHTLFTLDTFSGDQIKFECYNSNCTDIEFKELQRKILEVINYER